MAISMNPALSLMNLTSCHVWPPLVVFQIPPAAPATKNVFEGLGMPATLETRPPMLAGPTLRHRNPASRVESRGAVVCAASGGRAGETSARTTKRAQRRRDMTASRSEVEGCDGARSEERRVGKEGRTQGQREQEEK